HPLPSESLTAVLFAGGTAFGSGFLALIPGVIDNAVHHGWAGGGQAWASWLSLGFLAAAAALLGWAALRWRKRTTIIDRRGTAYIIDEVSASWQHEEKESELASIRKKYARTLLVPGPGELGERWQWQADAKTAGHWDERVDQLVRSFWAV